MERDATPDRRWLVTTADPGGGPGHIGHAIFIEAPDEGAAVEIAAHVLLDETDHDATTLSDCVVIPFDELPPRWRIVLGAEAVPEEFWCCGGMPFLDRPGSEDEHSATCSGRAPHGS
jgi:hypothetical protein